MAYRYIRLRTLEGKVHYGLLHTDRVAQILDAPPWLNGQPTDQQLPPDHYQLLAPCAPSKIVAVGKNYAKHAAEMGSPPPREPILFLKPPTTVIADRGEIFYPSQSSRVDYEGELALVMGDRICNCPPEMAHSKIWGYTIANDVTARDLQQQDGQWTRAKGFDTFCPLGPWVVREINPGAVLQTFLNEQLVQRVSVDMMLFAPHVLVSYISHVMTLLPGDIVLTGTPEGIGPMQVGDRVRVEIEGIGGLENAIVPRPTAC